jgi:hypothetical protein
MRTLWTLLVVVFVMPVGAQGPTLDIMPLTDVAVGQRGEVLVTYEGDTPRAFSFIVIAVDRIYSIMPRVLVRIQNPYAVLGTTKGNMVFKGMSGSPAYIHGRLVGALSETIIGARTSDAWITPVESIFRNIPRTRERETTVPMPDASAHLASGVPYVMCGVWGDLWDCSNATITAELAPGRWYAQGHATGEVSRTGVESGHTAIPVWRGTVQTTVFASDIGSAYAARIGEPVGTLIWNGATGHIIATDRTPKTMTVHVSLRGFTAQSLERTFHTSRTWYGGHRVIGALQKFTAHHISADECAWVEVRIEVLGLPEPVVFTDAGPNFKRPEGYDSLLNILVWMNHYVRPVPSIGAIRVKYRKADSCDLMEVRKASLAVNDSDWQVRILLRRERDWRRLVTQQSLAGPVHQPLRVYDGSLLQREFLEHLPFAEAVTMLNRYPDRAGLYVVQFHQWIEQVGLPTDAVPDGWQVTYRPLVVRMQVDSTGIPVFVPVREGIQVQGP